MRYFVFGLGVLAAFALMIAGGWMNWRFISSLGADAADQQALGLASLGVDAMKPALAYLMALAWDKRQWGYVGVGVVTYALLAAMSLASSFGFSAEGRDAVMSARQALTAHYRAAATELGEIEVEAEGVRAGQGQQHPRQRGRGSRERTAVASDPELCGDPGRGERGVLQGIRGAKHGAYQSRGGGDAGEPAG